MAKEKHILEQFKLDNPEPGEYKLKTSIGNILMKRSDSGRCTFYLDGKCRKIADLKTEITAAPPLDEKKKGKKKGKKKTEPGGSPLLPEGTGDKKFKIKKVLKAVPAADFLKKKQKKKFVAALNEYEGKKITGNDILQELDKGKNMPSDDIAAFFELI